MEQRTKTVKYLTYQEILLKVRTQTFDHNIRRYQVGAKLKIFGERKLGRTIVRDPRNEAEFFSPQISLVLIMSNDGGCDRWNAHSRVPETDRS